MKNKIVLSVLGCALCTAFAGPALAQENPLRDTVAAVRDAGVRLFAACQEKHGTCEAAFVFAPSECVAKATAEQARAYVGAAASDDSTIRSLDGWGFELEYWLPAEGCKNAGVGVRSAGEDGLFAEDSYEAGAFSAEDAEEDVVWQSGVFLRWPRR